MSTAETAVARAGAGRRRVYARIEGTVQGVGFRPHVYRLVRALELAGFVRNDARGVVVEIEGDAKSVERFFDRLPREMPPRARIERVHRRELPPRGERQFAITASAAAGEAAAPVSTDVASCDDCLRELRDSTDRRYRYPFVNCTQCGPRFTIVRSVPYDRPRTTMAGFAMCARCEAEYRDPTDRRFHAQPNACPACGPRLRLVDPSGNDTEDNQEPLPAAVTALRAGRILALKGLGGFHLACRADHPAAVAALRARKHRPHKPFALMAPDLAAARSLVELDAEAEALLQGPDAPIVLAPRRPDAPVAAGVAPGLADLGLMLPSTPLHHLLLGDIGTPLVMTSGNRGGEPIAHRDGEALRALAGIADLFLIHDRPIHVRADDSVVRTARPGPVLLRRARGHAPASLPLPIPAPRPLLACGADLKSVLCVAKGGRAWLSPHVGDLEDWPTFEAFRTMIDHMTALFGVRPEVVAHDLHPAYHSTRLAQTLDGVTLLGVQHHHAHLAAVLAEHGETGPAVGALFDGTGYGPDGTIWGGELLVGGLAGFERAGHLLPARMPGGERAIHEPWRMACAWLAADPPCAAPAASDAAHPDPTAFGAFGSGPTLCGDSDRDSETGILPRPGRRAPLAANPGSGSNVAGAPPPLATRISPAHWRAVYSLARKGSIAAPWTTSIGRLFDAVAAFCGLRTEVTYEGQAAIELEAAADPSERGAYPIPVVEEEPAELVSHPCADAAAPAPGTGRHAAATPHLVLDPRPALRCLRADISHGIPPARVSARFHAGLAAATAQACERLARSRSLDTVVLSGGVFQNRLLLEAVHARLTASGLRILLPRTLPPGDGAIAFGQAAIAAHRTSRITQYGRRNSGTEHRTGGSSRSGGLAE